MRNYRNNPTLEWLIETIGVARTFELCIRFGCTRVYVPARGANHSEFSTFLTAEELDAFADIWAGAHIKLPIARGFCCRYLNEVEELSVAAIARRLHMKEDSVRKALRRREPAVDFSAAKAHAEERRRA